MDFTQFQNEAPLERAFGLPIVQVRVLNISNVEAQLRRDRMRAEDAEKWRRAAQPEGEKEAREYLLAFDIAQTRHAGSSAVQTQVEWCRWFSVKSELESIWDEERARVEDATMVRAAAEERGINAIPNSVRDIVRLRSAKDAMGMVAARFVADPETQRDLSGPLSELVWGLTSALDPEVQAAFILGDGVRARVMAQLRRFGFDAYAALLARNAATQLSGREIYELRLRAIGMSDDDYDITDEYQFDD